MSGKDQAAQAETPPLKTQDSPLPEESVAAEPLANTAFNALPSEPPGMFPVEGDSKWISIMRLMAASILAGILLIGAAFHFLAADDSYMEQQQLALMLGGVVFLMMLEYFVFLLIIIPRQANFSRYILHQDKVEYFPLASLGLSAARKSQKVAIERFKGLATSGTIDKKGAPVFSVYLLHADENGKTINIKSFPAFHEAENYAKELGAALCLNVVAKPPGRKTSKKRAL